MENYVKVILYGYPLLKTVGKDYEAHVFNKAVLSYDSPMTAEKLAEYLAGEILEMRRLEWLKKTVEDVLERLQEEERELLSLRYFGKINRLRDFLKRKAEEEGWSERKYFRKQKNLEGKITAMFEGAGVTKELYDKELKDTDVFRKIHKFVELGKDKKISADERRMNADMREEKEASSALLEVAFCVNERAENAAATW